MEVRNMDEGGFYILMLLVMGYREPALAAPKFEDYAACVAAGKEMESRTKKLKGMYQGTTVVWYCTPYPRRD
jgi:hypothetical protein